MSYNDPAAIDDPLLTPFWAHARAHRLAVQRCAACGDLHFPPGPVCPVCLSEDQTWQEVSGKAELVSWTTFHRAYWPAFAKALPYDVCLVKLAEGPLLLSNFLGATPRDLVMGLPLRVVFDDVSDAVTLPKFVADVPHA